MTLSAKRLVLPVVSFTAALYLNAAETALVRVRWSEFAITDKVERVMANAHVTAKPLSDAQAIPLHDAGKTIVYDWETGNADDLLAAVGVGAEYVRTSRPLEARAIIGADAAKGKTAPVAASAFRIRDPFILADDATKTYYLYETTDPYKGRPYARGVSVRTSKDLSVWSRPQSVMSVPPKDRCRTVWAPEVYKVGNRYLMFATLSFYPDREGACGPNASRLECRRGTWIYASALPTGPFRPVTGMPATPEDMMALDGTLFMDGDRPYMVFCHEWVQVKTGGMCVAALKPDFSGLAETPRRLFDAAAAAPNSRVTDGPYLHRMKDGRLLMIWSTVRNRDEGYCVMQTESASGTVYGPWKEHKVIYGKNGGHGALFRTFEGALKLVLHGPNRRGLEHLRILDVAETSDGLSVSEPSGLRRRCRMALTEAVKGSSGRGTARFQVEMADGGGFCRKVGETVAVSASVKGKDGRAVSNGTVEAWVDDGWTNVVWRRSVDLAKEPVVKMSLSRSTPGTLRIHLSMQGVREKMDRVVFGAGEIMPLTPCPEDFESYWRGELAKLKREVPIAVERTPAPDLSTAEHDVFRVSFATFNGKRVYGFLSVPKGKGPFPVCVNVPGAGPGVVAPSSMRKDWINLTMNMHCFPIGRDKKEQKERYDAWLSDLWVRGGEPKYQRFGFAAGRDKPIYHDVVTGMVRALDWLADEPYADASRFFYYGRSQGGGFGIYLTSLWGRFAKSLIMCPNMCDMLAYKAGRQPGSEHILLQTPEHRPAAESTAPYYDACNFARLVRTPVRMVYGLSDDTNNTGGGIAAFNALGVADKDLRLLPGVGHGCDTAGFDAWLFDLPSSK